MRNPMRRPGFWIAIVVALSVVLVLVLRARGPAVRTTHAVRKDLEQHIVASGRVRVPTRVQIAAQTSGLVVAVGAVEGQHVKTGDLLVQIDDREQRAAVAQAEAAVKQATARVDQLRRVGAIVATQTLSEANSNLDRAQADLVRADKLVKSAAVPAIELENARRAVDIARAQRAAAEAQQIASAPMGADSRIALTALLQAQAQLAGANARLSQTRLIAPQDGTVLSRSVEAGDVVQPSRTLLVVAADADVELVFQSDERNLATLHVGQNARASADAYPQQVFDARVSFIAPSIDPQRGSVEIRLAVPEPPALLKPDMTVSIDLLVAAKQQTLTVSNEVVHGAATPTPWVLAVEAGRVVRHEVRLGIRGEGAVEIASGLTDGAEVIFSDGMQLEPGARVRPEPE
ncbi:MAG: efflux RND transporter periplasmic adaptor subunit [Kofleriaceae bacterium]